MHVVVKQTGSYRKTDTQPVSDSAIIKGVATTQHIGSNKLISQGKYASCSNSDMFFLPFFQSDKNQRLTSIGKLYQAQNAFQFF